MADASPLTCALCGKGIDAVPNRRGPAPKYCCQAHRQRAYEQRRRGAQRRDPDDARALVELDNHRLRRDNEGLRRENDKLRGELRAALTDVYALRAAQPGHPAGVLPGLGHRATPEPAPIRSSRWLARRPPR